jgi:membrane-associated phospholipid phosphatase
MPSNHAQFAGFAAAYFCLWALSGRWRVAPAWRRAAACAAAAAAAAVCASRVYLRYHDAAQVAAGVAVGAAAAAAWHVAVERACRPRFAAVAASPLARALLVRDCSAANVIEDEYAAVAGGGGAGGGRRR